MDWSKHRVYVIGHNRAVEHLFNHKGISLVDNIGLATIVVWTGGHDVSPALYGENIHPKTHCYPKRDLFEKSCYNRAMDGKRLLVGICRGGQFLNVMNGGQLWQHVDGHGLVGEHPMWYRTHAKTGNFCTERQVMVNSTHHQMMIPNSRPPGTSHVWGYAGCSTLKESGSRMGEGKGELFKVPCAKGHNTDCEIVFYPKTRSLCFQPHPEYTSRSTTETFWACVERALETA